MKPKFIIFVRHGESEGNVDKRVYKEVPDHRIALTDKGRHQAARAGDRLHVILSGTPHVLAYTSPFLRAKQTAEALNIEHSFQEDPRLREQEWIGRKFDERYQAHVRYQERERIDYSTFYYRFHGGESVADVYDRMCSFTIDLFDTVAAEDTTVVIVSHGMAIRALIMRLTKASVTDFESWRNPPNASIMAVELRNNTYHLCNDPVFDTLRYRER